MSDRAAAEAAREQRWIKLKDAKEKLQHYPLRKVGPGESEWPRAWITDVCQTIAEVIKLGQIAYRDRGTIEFLVDNQLIDFRNGEDPSASVVNWTAADWFDYLGNEPYLVLKMFEKCADVLPREYHKKIVEEVLENVNKRLLSSMSEFAPDVIRISFARCEDLLSYKLMLSAFRTCRLVTFVESMTAYYVDEYMNFWGTLIKYFPRNSANFKSVLLVGYDDSNPMDQKNVYPKMTPERYILQISVQYRNVFDMRQKIGVKRYKIGMLKLWESLDFDRMERVFYAQDKNPLLDDFFDTIKLYASERNSEILHSLSNLLLKLCDHFRVHNWVKLLDHLRDVRDMLLSRPQRSYEVLRLAVLLSYKLSCKCETKEPYILPIPKEDLNCFRDKRFKYDVKNHFDDTLLFVNTYHRNPDFEKLSKIQELLGYGSESFTPMRDLGLSTQQIAHLGELYHFERKLGNEHVFLKDFRNFEFGEIKLTHETFPDYLNLISSFAMAHIGKHLEELTFPAEERMYLHPSSGLKIFDASVNIGFSLLLDTLLENVELLNSRFANENYRMDIFSQPLCYYKKSSLTKNELERFAYGMAKELEEFLNSGKGNLNRYFVPLVEMVTISMEALDFKKAHEKYFENFYVPAVKALLVFNPSLALQLIVAFARAQLRLNLSATYPETNAFKTHWQQVRELQTPEVVKQHFEGIHVTLRDVYSRSAEPVPHKNETIMMDRYVSAAVNYYEYFDAETTKDYLVARHYYDILAERGICDEKLKNLPDVQVHDILLDR